MSTYDVVIVGGGVVGATAALALAKHSSLKIALLDAQTISHEWQDQKIDHRVSAISLASQKIFEKLKVWEKIRAKRVSHYSHMHVWEEGFAKIDFDCTDVRANSLGCIVEDTVLRSSLHAAIRECGNINLLYAMSLSELHEKPDVIELVAAHNQKITAKLLVAADGAHSWVREQVKVPLKTVDYQHTAIVATVKTQLQHQATAWQRFSATGTLAFLPLRDPHLSSIVWSTLPQHAEELLAQDDTLFKKSLGEAFSHKLGDVLLVDKRYHFPLRMRHAKNYVKHRIALIGDAAHTIHPLAGQGVNMGLQDAICLSSVVLNALNKNRDFASFATLRRYERPRKTDNLIMLTAVDVLKKLFMSDKKNILQLRHFGLNFTDNASWLKNFFTNYALGSRQEKVEL